MTLPLKGCRILDLGIITAGAATSSLLADLGADVIKVESPNYRDPFRGWSPTRTDPGRFVPPFFAWTNRNKRAISLDLKQAAGRRAFLRLVAVSDIVVENFRRGVLDRLGLDYASLRAVNSDVILASISSAGETGPDANCVSYGTTLEALGGLAWSSGYADGAPEVTGRDLNYPDQVVAIFATGMIATAWRARRAGRSGTHLDLSQRELTSFLCGEVFVAGDAGADPRTGNAQPPFVLQDCFRGSDGVWVAISAEADNAPALATLIAAPAGGPDRNWPELMRQWCAGRIASEAVDRLRQAGIAAAAVQNGRDMLQDEGRLWSFALDRAPDGQLLKGFPFQLRNSPMTIRRHAPGIGADTDEILSTIGGFSVSEIEALKRDGVIESQRDRSENEKPPETALNGGQEAAAVKSSGA